MPYVITVWPLTVLPQIMELNFDVQSDYDISDSCKNFLIMFNWGSLLGAFIWPILIKFISMKDSLFLSVAVQSILMYLMSLTASLNQILILRFISGVFENTNNVGKAFVFEFAPKDLI